MGPLIGMLTELCLFAVINGHLGMSIGPTYTAGYSSVPLTLALRCTLTVASSKLTLTDPLLSRRTGNGIRLIWLSRPMVTLLSFNHMQSY